MFIPDGTHSRCKCQPSCAMILHTKAIMLQMEGSLQYPFRSAKKPDVLSMNDNTRLDFNCLQSRKPRNCAATSRK